MRKVTTDMSGMASAMSESFKVLEETVKASGNPAAEQALANVSTYVAVSLEVLQEVRPTKIRSAARTVEIRARIHGRPVIEAD